MKSVKTIHCDVIIHHYIYSDLKEFIKLGKRDGNVGMILVREDGKAVTYKGFGTIENPFRWINTFTMVRCPLFDDPLSAEPLLDRTNSRMIVLDLGETNK